MKQDVQLFTSGAAIAARIENRLGDLGMTPNAASKKAGLHRDYIGKFVLALKSGRQTGMLTETLRKLAPALETTVGWLSEGTGTKSIDPNEKPLTRNNIATRGVVAHGGWRNVTRADMPSEYQRTDNLFPVDPRYPTVAQYDLIVQGSSINRIAAEGYRLRCIDFSQVPGLKWRDGDLVIVHRTRDNGRLEEYSAKRIKRLSKADFGLHTDSNDPQFFDPDGLDGQVTIQPSNDPEHETISIVALVIYAYQAMRSES